MLPEIVSTDLKSQSLFLWWFPFPPAGGMDNCRAPKTEASRKPTPINGELAATSSEYWRPVRESNPCRRREREATYCNSTELSGMDSTLPHLKDSRERLLDL